MSTEAWIALGIVVAVAAAVLLTRSIWRPWIRAFFAGHPLHLVHLVGMRLRRVDTWQVSEAWIMAGVGGVPLSDPSSLEMAYLAGADLEEVMKALVLAQMKGVSMTVAEAVEHDLAGESPVDVVLARAGTPAQDVDAPGNR